MTASVQVKDFLYRVSKDLGDIAPQFTRWTQKELINATNDGQRTIAKYLPYSCSRLDAIQLVAGSRQYIGVIPSARVIPGDNSVAADVRCNTLLYLTRNMGIDGKTPGKALQVVDREVLDMVQPDWHSSAKLGKRPGEYTFDPRTPQIFFVNPPVYLTDVSWVEAAFLADPNAISNLSTDDYGQASVYTRILSIDDTYVADLLNYVLARASMKDMESQASLAQAQAYTALFVASINTQSAAMTGTNPNLQSLPFNGLAGGRP